MAPYLSLISISPLSFQNVGANQPANSQRYERSRNKKEREFYIKVLQRRKCNYRGGQRHTSWLQANTSSSFDTCCNRPYPIFILNLKISPSCGKSQLQLKYQFVKPTTMECGTSETIRPNLPTPQIINKTPASIEASTRKAAIIGVAINPPMTGIKQQPGPYTWYFEPPNTMRPSKPSTALPNNPLFGALMPRCHGKTHGKRNSYHGNY